MDAGAVVKFYWNENFLIQIDILLGLTDYLYKR